MSRKTAIIWFRRDLRLADNPALTAACESHEVVVPLFLWPPEDESGPRRMGEASRWWLHHSLAAHARSLRERGLELTIRRGAALDVLRDVATKCRAAAVFWNRCYDPSAISADAGIEAALQQDGLRVESFNSHLLLEPSENLNRANRPFQVFTPFWNSLRKRYRHESPLGVPETRGKLSDVVPSLSLESLELLPKVPWDAEMRAAWEPGEAAAQRCLGEFLSQALGRYRDGRDSPSTIGTSRLSPYLHFGEIGPRQIWDAVTQALTAASGALSGADAEAYLRQLAWREFAHHLLFHFPQTPDEPLRKKFRRFPWTSDRAGLKAWQRGATGYPIVDAGMRELWNTGWMHNRVRMITGSFLVKDLLVPWQEGAKWFWNTLVDADLANNTLGWQWISGCGADAAPYFRIFNPVMQGEKFDPEGEYVKRWVPELKNLPARWIHKPWLAPAGILSAAGVELGTTYPHPLVDHAEARDRALEAFSEL